MESLWWVRSMWCCCNANSWQLQQFPAHLQSKIKVIFDGIDTNFFRHGVVEGDLRLHDEVTGHPFVFPPERRILSYATRVWSQCCGFPEFMRMLPPLLEYFGILMWWLQAVIGLHIVIQHLVVMAPGSNGCCKSYGPAATHQEYILQVYWTSASTVSCCGALTCIAIFRGHTLQVGAFSKQSLVEPHCCWIKILVLIMS